MTGGEMKYGRRGARVNGAGTDGCGWWWVVVMGARLDTAASMDINAHAALLWLCGHDDSLQRLWDPRPI